jgi:hypothetical protein
LVWLLGMGNRACRIELGLDVRHDSIAFAPLAHSPWAQPCTFARSLGRWEVRCWIVARLQLGIERRKQRSLHRLHILWRIDSSRDLLDGPLKINIGRERVGVGPGIGRRICWRHLPHRWGGPATRSEVEKKRGFFQAALICRIVGWSTIGPAVPIVARCWPGSMLSCLGRSKVGRPCTLVRWLYARRICRMSVSLSIRSGICR